MQACRYALEVVAKHPIYLLVYVGFLGSSVVSVGEIPA